MTALAAIHVAKKQLGLDDDTYRALLTRVTGKSSSAVMTEGERESVVEELRRQGFRPAPSTGSGRSRNPGSKAGRKPLQGRFAKKLQALWIAAWNLGLVENRDDAALIAFIKRQTGIDHPRFLIDTAEARKAIEALKSWIAREAGVEWASRSALDFLNYDPGRIAWAQFRKLVPGATLMGNRSMFEIEIERIIAAPYGRITPAGWRAVMNAFGARIRRKSS